MDAGGRATQDAKAGARTPTCQEENKLVTYIAANIAIFFIAIVGLFQLALVIGMPWVNLAMGGRFPGKLPPAMRVAAFVQVVILAIIGIIIFVRAGLLFPEWLWMSKKIIWGVVLFNVLGLILNLATPSKWERIVWAPVVAVLLVCSIVVALG